LGYALTLDHDVETGEPIRSDGRYAYVVERGPVATVHETRQNGLELTGQTLLDMQTDNYTNAETLAQSKALMRMVINHHLGNQNLHTRQLLRDLQQF
jgi:DNA repair protein RecO (recombination protein O)